MIVHRGVCLVAKSILAVEGGCLFFVPQADDSSTQMYYKGDIMWMPAKAYVMNTCVVCFAQQPAHAENVVDVRVYRHQGKSVAVLPT